MRHVRGFTLIELMIVIAIVGILLAIAIPAYQDYTVRAKVSEGLSLAASPKLAVLEYFHSTGGLPADNTSAGLQAPGDFATEFITAIEVGDPAPGHITVTFDAGPDGLPELGADNLLSLVPVTGNDHVDWRCGGGNTTVEARYLPAVCR